MCHLYGLEWPDSERGQDVLRQVVSCAQDVCVLVALCGGSGQSQATCRWSLEDQRSQQDGNLAWASNQIGRNHIKRRRYSDLAFWPLSILFLRGKQGSRLTLARILPGVQCD